MSQVSPHGPEQNPNTSMPGSEAFAVMLDIGELVEWASDLNYFFAADEVLVMAGRVSREEAPALLAQLDAEGLLTDEASVVVGSLWSGIEYPHRDLDKDTWRQVTA